MRLKLSFLLVGLLLINSTLCRAAEQLQDALQKGLLEEEANQNLPAAIKAYQAALSQFESERKIAATATFRLAECYRKLGRTNEALAQYERVVKSFADQTALVTVSQQQLLSAGRSAETGVALNSTVQSTVDSEQAKLLRQEIALVQQQLDDKQKQIAVGQANSSDVLPLKQQILNLERLLPENASSDQQQKLIQEQVQNAQQGLLELQKKLEVGQAAPSDLIPAKTNLLEFQRQLLALTNRPQFTQRLNQIVRRSEPSEELAAGDANTEGEAKQIERLKEMIKNSPDLINAQNGKNTPLESAAMSGFVNVARFLLDNGADVQGRGEGYETPLHYAAEAGQKAIVQLLLDRGAKPDTGDNSGETALHYAARNGFRAVGQVLLEKGANVNARSNNGTTPLMDAAARGQQAMVELLLANKADVNLADNGGWTALMVAAQQRNQPTLTALLAANPDINAQAKNGATALTLAIKAHGFSNWAQILLEHGADPNVRTGWSIPNVTPPNSTHDETGLTPLEYAVETGQPKAIELLLKYKAQVDAKDEHGLTALQRALKWHSVPIVQRLLEAGANPNLATEEGITPLILALHVLRGDGTGRAAPVATVEAIVTALLQRGADPNALGAGVTPLLEAVNLHATNIVNQLLEKGANVNGKSVNGYTPLHVAAAQGYTQIVRQLIDKGADVNAKDEAGNTPLHYAVYRAHREVVQLLLKTGADPNSVNGNGQTPGSMVMTPGPHANLNNWGIPVPGGFGGIQVGPSPQQKAIIDELLAPKPTAQEGKLDKQQ